MQIKAGFLKCPEDVMFKMGLRCTWSWRHQILLWQELLLLVEWLNTSTWRKNPTSRSMLRAATELSSLKSISEDASVLRKLPSVKRKRREQFIQWELMMLDWMFKSSYITIKCEAKFLFYDKFKLNFQTKFSNFLNRPFMLLWKSWGKMPLGASWWNIQRRNCLATPATFPGINILQDIAGRMAVLEGQSHLTYTIKVIYKHSEHLHTLVLWLLCLIPLSLSRKIATGCQPERSQSSRLGLRDELCMSSKSELWNFI